MEQEKEEPKGAVITMPEGYPFLKLVSIYKNKLTNEYQKRKITIDYTHIEVMYWRAHKVNNADATKARLSNGEMIKIALPYKAASELIEPFNTYKMAVLYASSISDGQ